MDSLQRVPLDGRDLTILLGLILAQVVLFVFYWTFVPDPPTTLRFALYPLVWITIGVWAILTVDVGSAPRRWKLGSAAIAGLYFLVLLWVSGLLSFFPDPQVVEAMELVSVEPGSPGWERMHVVTGWVAFTFLTFRTVGFLALTYLVYVTLLDASRSALSGALGLFACVGCTFPILASLGAGIFGGTAAAGQIYGMSMDISTAIFVATVLLLYYRPWLESGQSE